MKKHISKHLSLILAAAMLFSLFAFSSCNEQAVNDVLDAALAVVEALPDAETDGHVAAEDLSETSEQSAEPEMNPVPEEEKISEEAEDEGADEVSEGTDSSEDAKITEEAEAIDENGTYDDRESVALYIHTYGKLPPNYITKAEAEDLGWEGGSVEKYAPGKCIGGSRFGNYEGLLPKKDGRQYYECDIGTLGKNSRGAERIVYSNDGLIYYTGDHYESFELLYGED